MTDTALKTRRTFVRTAFVLEWLTIAWMTVEATVAVGSGIIAHSITLVAFGADSMIELISASVLIWRLDIELRRGREFSQDAEERAARIAGVLLYALALYIMASAGWGLLHRRGEDFSLPGFVLAIVAIPTMYLLAKRKLSVASEIGSRALRADAAETITCGYLSFVVVVGLLAQLLFRAWWIDAVTSLAIVYFVVKEAREAWSGGACACSDAISLESPLPSNVQGD